MKNRIKHISGFVNTMDLLFILCFAFSCGGSANSSDQEGAVKPPKQSIHEAAFFGNLAAIEQHIKAGSNLNEKDQFGSTPLTIAATFGKTDIALALIDGEADITIRSADGSSPLHTAAFFCRTEIVASLLEKGADVSIVNDYGSTALQSVAAPFDQVKPIYDQISRDLGPLGLKLDYDYLKTTRPIVAELIEKYN